jgi:DNA processing protein
VWKALGLNPKQVVRPREPAKLEATSAEAKAAYRLLERVPRGFDEVLVSSRLDPAALASALSELEMQGLIIQHPGKLYERV